MAVDAKTWYNYQGGIIQYHCETDNNHAVQIVGYDTTGEWSKFTDHNVSCIMRKPVLGVSEQPQKMARGLKFWI